MVTPLGKTHDGKAGSGGGDGIPQIQSLKVRREPFYAEDFLASLSEMPDRTGCFPLTPLLWMEAEPVGTLKDCQSILITLIYGKDLICFSVFRKLSLVLILLIFLLCFLEVLT
jgi:hypothetical protein